MGVFDRQRATATRLITKYGAACEWLKTGSSGGTAASPTPGVLTPYPCRIVFLTPKLEGLRTFLTLIAETEIPTGGLLGLMAANITFNPELTDSVKMPDGSVVGLLDENGIDKLDPNNEGALLWRLRFTR